MCLLKVPGAGRLAVRAVFLRLFLTIQTRPLCFMLPQRRGTEPQSILSSRSGCVSRYSQACRMQVAGGGLLSVCLPFSTKPRVSRIAAATCLVSTSPHPPSMLSLYFCSPSRHPVLDLFLWDTPPLGPCPRIKAWSASSSVTAGLHWPLSVFLIVSLSAAPPRLEAILSLLQYIHSLQEGTVPDTWGDV